MLIKIHGLKEAKKFISERMRPPDREIFRGTTYKVWELGCEISIAIHISTFNRALSEVLNEMKGETT